MLRLVTEMFVFISKCCKVDISNCQFSSEIFIVLNVHKTEDYYLWNTELWHVYNFSTTGLNLSVSIVVQQTTINRTVSIVLTSAAKTNDNSIHLSINLSVCVVLLVLSVKLSVTV